jgi:cell wall-associated NlpC family hydrolase
MNLCKSLSFCLSFAIFSMVFTVNTNAQERSRIVERKPSNLESQNYQQDYPPAPTTKIQRSAVSLPTNIPGRTMLTNNITVVDSARTHQPLVKKTASSQPTNSVPSNYQPTNSVSSNYIAKKSYGGMFNQRLLQSIQTKIGIPYRYGSNGPTSYDCSGLVWSVFGDAGFNFERTSARTLWQNSEPVEGDDKYKFGTLVFFNGLGHIGIVADANGFYHASSSQGVTYSTFAGYWGKRIVGFRRMNIDTTETNQVVEIAQARTK